MIVIIAPDALRSNPEFSESINISQAGRGTDTLSEFWLRHIFSLNKLSGTGIVTGEASIYRRTDLDTR